MGDAIRVAIANIEGNLFDRIDKGNLLQWIAVAPGSSIPMQ
jgi:hypothetical protein